MSHDELIPEYDTLRRERVSKETSRRLRNNSNVSFWRRKGKKVKKRFLLPEEAFTPEGMDELLGEIK